MFSFRYGKGVVLSKLGRHDDAILHFERALALVELSTSEPRDGVDDKEPQMPLNLDKNLALALLHRGEGDDIARGLALVQAARNKFAGGEHFETFFETLSLVLEVGFSR